MTLRQVPLSIEEILPLDGKVNPDAQAVIDKVKEIVGLGGDTPENRLLASLIGEAKTKGIIAYSPTFIHDCRLCGFRGEYQTYKSGRNRGSMNFDKPRTGKYGVELAHRFVRVKGSVEIGGCKECIEVLIPRIRTVLADWPCQLPGQLLESGDVRYKVSPTMVCPCGWEGHEELMRKERTMMGDGLYPAGCPNCTLRNDFVRSPIKTDRDRMLLMNMATKDVFPVGTSLSELRQRTNHDGATRPVERREGEAEAPKKTTGGKPMTNNSDAALRVLEGERE